MAKPAHRSASMTVSCLLRWLIEINASQTIMKHWSTSAAVSLRQRPELDDIQWNEAATPDSLIDSLLFLLLFKKSYILSTATQMCYDFRVCQKKWDRKKRHWMRREDGVFACSVVVYIVHVIRNLPWCHSRRVRSLMRPPILGYWCNCPSQAIL